MKPLSDSREWPKLAVYDIEATEWVNVCLVGHMDEYGNRLTFPTIALYLEWLFSRAFAGEHVWAHWGGHYDHRFVIHHATLHGWGWETIQSGNTIIIVSVTHKNGKTIRFCESARLMPDSVARIGKTVGLAKLDVDRANIQTLTADEVKEYCLRDCEIVLRGLQYLRKALTSVGADFAYTLASIASRWVRRSSVLQWHRFFDQTSDGPVYSKRMLQLDNFCLPSYFGGRVEVFKRGTFKGPLYYYDVRSSYPWSMLHDLPTYPRGETGFAPPRSRLDKSLERSGISEATVTVPLNTHIPLLCKRHEGKLVFPVGSWRGRFTNLELAAAYERGVKIDLHGQAVFEPVPFLRPFVDTFYGLRQAALEEGDAFRSYAYKIALNSLYGKLVEQIERMSILFGSKRVTRALREYGSFRPGKEEYVIPTRTPGVYALTSKSEGPFRHVAAGAYVTARSRLRLLQGMEAVRRQGGNIYYCDTDSIVTDLEMPMGDGLMDDELGCFKLESIWNEGEFIAPKVYRAEISDGSTLYKVKGIPVKGLTPEESRARWDAYISGETVEKDGISGFATDLRAGTVAPSRFVLARAMRSIDSKRHHSGENSIPLTFTSGVLTSGAESH